ncbi:FecR domain-containing protein [Novosphingobium sp.]|uniref:FecR family protein n=1 Tax=Novosphingobium sp. TaxID=1874826 RepID=UPI0031DF221F
MRDDGKAGASLSDQATQWLVALDAGSADRDEFEAWRGADPRHAATFAQVAATWRRTADPRLPAILEQPPEEQVSEIAGDVAPHASASPTRRAVMGGAAGLLALAGAGAFLAAPRRASAQTAIGERRLVRLQDGSQAMLNTDTRISWRFDEGGRDLWIERGEAALLVSDASQPFRLFSDPVDARLSAGKFSLRLDAAEAQLLVLAGQAAATYGGAMARTLGAGSRLTLRGGAGQIASLSPEDMVSATAWEQGDITFRGMPLAQAVAEFNRYLPVKIVLADAQLGRLQLGGTFHTASPDAFLAALQDGFGIANRREGDAIVLYRARGA